MERLPKALEQAPKAAVPNLSATAPRPMAMDCPRFALALCPNDVLFGPVLEALRPIAIELLAVALAFQPTAIAHSAVAVLPDPMAMVLTSSAFARWPMAMDPDLFAREAFPILVDDAPDALAFDPIAVAAN